MEPSDAATRDSRTTQRRAVDARRSRSPRGRGDTSNARSLDNCGDARTLDSVKVRRSACKHGVTEQDIAHAFRNAVKFIPYEYDGEERLLVIGPARNGAMLELTAVPADDPDRIIHADDLRPSFYHYLK
jgi:uncharacterized DUF497 family protein